MEKQQTTESAAMARVPPPPTGSTKVLRDRARQLRDLLRNAASHAPDTDMGDNWHFAFRAADDCYEALRKLADHPDTSNDK